MSTYPYPLPPPPPLPTSLPPPPPVLQPGIMKTRRFSFLSFSSLADADAVDEPTPHETHIFPRLKAGISAARKKVERSSTTTPRPASMIITPSDLPARTPRRASYEVPREEPQHVPVHPFAREKGRFGSRRNKKEQHDLPGFNRWIEQQRELVQAQRNGGGCAFDSPSAARAPLGIHGDVPIPSREHKRCQTRQGRKQGESPAPRTDRRDSPPHPKAKRASAENGNCSESQYTEATFHTALDPPFPETLEWCHAVDQLGGDMPPFVDKTKGDAWLEYSTPSKASQVDEEDACNNPKPADKNENLKLADEKEDPKPAEEDHDHDSDGSLEIISNFNYPIGTCPDNNPKCHLHQTDRGVEVHHDRMDHAEYERYVRRTNTTAKCWSRNRIVLDRTRERKGKRIDKAWKDAAAFKPQWIEGKTFGQLFKAPKDQRSKDRNSKDEDRSQNSKNHVNGHGHRKSSDTYRTGHNHPNSLTNDQANNHTSHPNGHTKNVNKVSGAAENGHVNGRPYAPVRSRARHRQYIQDDIPGFYPDPSPLVAPPKPPAPRASMPPSTIIATVPSHLSALSHGHGSEANKENVLGLGCPDTKNGGRPRQRSSRVSAPPALAEVPHPVPTTGRHMLKGGGLPKGRLSNPNGTIRKYLGMTPADLANAVANAQHMIANAGLETAASGCTHLLDNDGTQDNALGDQVSANVDIHDGRVPVSSHIAFSNAEDDAAQEDLTLVLRGTRYKLPWLTVQGTPILETGPYWFLVQNARIVDLTGDVLNLVAPARRIANASVVRLILRGQRVPWQLHVRCDNLITFTAVPWKPSSTKAREGVDFFGQNNSALIRVGPVPVGVRRHVLHVVYDDCSPGMNVSRFERLRTPASLLDVVVIFQRERRFASSGSHLTPPQVAKTPLVVSLLDEIVAALHRNAQLDFTLVGFEELAGTEVRATDRAVLIALAGLDVAPEVAAARVRVLSHAEYAEEVGPVGYMLETSV